MSVRINNSRQNSCAVQIDGASTSAEESPRFFTSSHPRNTVTLNRYGLCRGSGLIHGDNMRIEQEQIRRRRWSGETVGAS